MSSRFAGAFVRSSAVCAAGVFGHGQDAAKEPTVVVIRGATLIPFHGDATRLGSQTVIVRGGRIAWVGPSQSAPKVENARSVNAEGKYLIPGLIDAHVHLFDESQLVLYLANGVTSVFNMTGTPRILTWRDEIKAGARVGPTIFTTGPQIKDKPLPVYDGVIAVESVAEVPQLIQIHHEMGYEMVKIWSSLPPHVYDAIARECRTSGLRLTGHVASRVGLRGALASGQESVAHLEELVNKFFNRNLDRNGFANAAAILREANVPVITTISTYAMIVDTGFDERLAARLARPENRYLDPMLLELWKPESNEYRHLMDRRDYFEKARLFQIDMAKALHDRGVTLLAGTDAGLFMPNIVPGWSLHRELEFLARSGLTPADVLRAATAAPGDYLDAGSGRGRIRVGAPADLVLLNKDPLDAIGHTRSIEAVVANGVYYARDDLDEMLESVASGHDRARKFLTQLLSAGAQAAIREVREAVEQHGDAALLSESSLLTAAYLLAKQDKTDDSIAVARLTRRLHPKSYLAAYFHAGLCEMGGMEEERREGLREVLRLVPRHAQARRILDRMK